MRNYKVWEKTTSEMLPCYEISFDFNEVIVKRSSEKEQEIIDKGYHHCCNCDPEYDDFLFFDECIFMQSTGLKDKNNKEIYDGDIVKCLYSVGNGVVYWDHGLCGFKILSETGMEHLFDTTGESDYGTNMWEVLGNIYENSNLVSDKVKDKHTRIIYE